MEKFNKEKVKLLTEPIPFGDGTHLQSFPGRNAFTKKKKVDAEMDKKQSPYRERIKKVKEANDLNFAEMASLRPPFKLLAEPIPSTHKIEREAIADVKTVKHIALENAKKALSEAAACISPFKLPSKPKLNIIKINNVVMGMLELTQLAGYKSIMDCTKQTIKCPKAMKALEKIRKTIPYACDDYINSMTDSEMTEIAYKIIRQEDEKVLKEDINEIVDHVAKNTKTSLIGDLQAAFQDDDYPKKLKGKTKAVEREDGTIDVFIQPEMPAEFIKVDFSHNGVFLNKND